MWVETGMRSAPAVGICRLRSARFIAAAKASRLRTRIRISPSRDALAGGEDVSADPRDLVGDVVGEHRLRRARRSRRARSSPPAPPSSAARCAAGARHGPGSVGAVRGMRLVGRSGDLAGKLASSNTVSTACSTSRVERNERKSGRATKRFSASRDPAARRSAASPTSIARRGALEAEDRLLVVADREDRARSRAPRPRRRRNPRRSPSPPSTGRGSCPAPRRPGCARRGGRACRAPTAPRRRATGGCAPSRSGRRNRARRRAAWRRDRPAGWRRRR